jgi:hypothetical protein
MENQKVVDLLRSVANLIETQTEDNTKEVSDVKLDAFGDTITPLHWENVIKGTNNKLSQELRSLLKVGKAAGGQLPTEIKEKMMGIKPEIWEKMTKPPTVSTDEDVQRTLDIMKRVDENDKVRAYKTKISNQNTKLIRNVCRHIG